MSSPTSTNSARATAPRFRAARRMVFDAARHSERRRPRQELRPSHLALEGGALPGRSAEVRALRPRATAMPEKLRLTARRWMKRSALCRRRGADCSGKAQTTDTALSARRHALEQRRRRARHARSDTRASRFTLGVLDSRQRRRRKLLAPTATCWISSISYRPTRIIRRRRSAGQGRRAIARVRRVCWRWAAASSHQSGGGDALALSAAGSTIGLRCDQGDSVELGHGHARPQRLEPRKARGDGRGTRSDAPPAPIRSARGNESSIATTKQVGHLAEALRRLLGAAPLTPLRRVVPIALGTAILAYSACTSAGL